MVYDHLRTWRPSFADSRTLRPNWPRRDCSSLPNVLIEEHPEEQRQRVVGEEPADVPWNAPYYERIGFRVIDDLGPQLAAVVNHERRVIPGDAPRVAMARPV